MKDPKTTRSKTLNSGEQDILADMMIDHFPNGLIRIHFTVNLLQLEVDTNGKETVCNDMLSFSVLLFSFFSL